MNTLNISIIINLNLTTRIFLVLLRNARSIVGNFLIMYMHITKILELIEYLNIRKY